VGDLMDRLPAYLLLVDQRKNFFVLFSVSYRSINPLEIFLSVEKEGGGAEEGEKVRGEGEKGKRKKKENNYYLFALFDYLPMASYGDYALGIFVLLLLIAVIVLAVYVGTCNNGCKSCNKKKCKSSCTTCGCTPCVC
jgi:hypothetical protein